MGVGSSCNSLKNIEISEGVTLIADNAFRCCDSLESVEIPKSVKEIGRYAFASCNSLKSIKISKGVKEIRECAFASCNSLKNIEIPEGVTLIADRAFIQCNSLKDVTIKEKNTSIGFWAFDSANYKKMTIRGLLDSKAEAYAKYKNIKFVYLDNKTTNNGLRYYVNDDNSVYITGYNGSEKNLKIPSKIDGKKVKRIVDFAFYECESLENIKIPKEVTSIGRWAFDSANYEKMTIRGVPGSTAEKYAKSKKIKFVNIYKKNIIIYTIIGIIALVLLAVVFIKRNKFRNKDNKATSKENEAISKENEATSKENKPIEAENENKELSKNKNMAINKVIFRKDKDK